MEDLGSTPAERQMKIKARLKKFFNKRPSMEHLVKKGIWKGWPFVPFLFIDFIFCHLHCKAQPLRLFVKHTLRPMLVGKKLPNFGLPLVSLLKITLVILAYL